jgi:hypothetical protein
MTTRARKRTVTDPTKPEPDPLQSLCPRDTSGHDQSAIRAFGVRAAQDCMVGIMLARTKECDHSRLTRIHGASHSCEERFEHWKGARKNQADESIGILGRICRQSSRVYRMVNTQANRRNKPIGILGKIYRISSGTHGEKLAKPAKRRNKPIGILRKVCRLSARGLQQSFARLIKRRNKPIGILRKVCRLPGSGSQRSSVSLTKQSNEPNDNMGGFGRLSGFNRPSSLDGSKQRNKAISVIADGEGSRFKCIYSRRTHTRHQERSMGLADGST